jgi:hypothetical protein
MGQWPDAATARDNLRRFLNDGPQDRLRKSKPLLGMINGDNTRFFTYEDRIVEPFGVHVTVDLVDVTSTLDDAVIGQVTLASPPPTGAQVRAMYFCQYFLDEDLDEALQGATQQIIETDDVTQVPVGLKMAALNYAGHFAFTKQAIRWAERMSEHFVLEDAPAEGQMTQTANHFLTLARSFFTTANTMRESFYKRDSRRQAPAWGVYQPQIPPVGPIR